MINVRFKDTLRERLPEWISVIGMLLWGIIALNMPAESWNQEHFQVISSMGTQLFWGTLTTVLGTLRLIALIINGQWRPTAHIRGLGALCGVLVWSTISVGYLTLDALNTGIAPRLCMLALDVSALWYAAEDAKRADVKAKKLMESSKADVAI